MSLPRLTTSWAKPTQVTERGTPAWFQEALDRAKVIRETSWVCDVPVPGKPEHPSPFFATAPKRRV